MIFTPLYALALAASAAPLATPESPADSAMVVSPASLAIQGTDVVFRPSVGASDPDYRPDLSINVTNGRLEVNINGANTSATIHPGSANGRLNIHFGYAPVGQTTLNWSTDGTSATLTYNGSPYFYACAEGANQYIYVVRADVASQCASPQWLKISG